MPARNANAVSATSAPAAVDDQRVATAGDLGDLGRARVLGLLLVRRVGDRPRHGVVLLAGDDQQRTAVGVRGVHARLGPRVEVGGGGLEQRRARPRARRRSRRARSDSASATALPNAKRNCFSLSITARRGCAGWRAPATAAFSAETGSGSTPRNGAGSMATDAAASPSPASFWVIRPPNECPMTTGLRCSSPITSA